MARNIHRDIGGYRLPAMVGDALDKPGSAQKGLSALPLMLL